MALYEQETDIRSDMVRLLHRWWLGKSNGAIPDRADLDPADLKPLLPNLFIADVEHAPFRIRYRLVGTKATEATGFDLTGRYLDDLMPSTADQPWGDYYHRAYRTRLPVFGSIHAPTRNGGDFLYEFGLFPLRKGGTAVDQFVAIEDYFDLASTHVQLVEWRELEAAKRLSAL
ncbi:MAG: PAS domain-containing protein [Dongiaceae bacterium]